MNTDVLLKGLVASMLFSAVGLAVFVAGFYVIRLLLPFDVYKEIETDHNVALGVVIGSFVLGLSIIIAAAIHG
jgi:putative membrane protein